MSVLAVIKKPRLKELDRGKGLAILLVVIGHIVAREPPVANGWYEMLKFSIYLFHMPFFIFISGIAMSYSYRNVADLREYIQYIKPKFFRFIPIFFIFGILILIGKTISANYIQVDNNSDNLILGLQKLFLYPGISPASTLWYIYVLFMYYMVFPFFAPLKNYKLLYLITFSSLLLCFYSYNLSLLFLIDRFSAFLFFVVLGWLVGRHYERFINIVKLLNWWSVVLFALTVFFLNAYFYKCIIFHECTYFPIWFHLVHAMMLCGVLSIPALIFLLRFSLFSKSVGLERIGKYVFVIYLFNTIIMGLVKGVGLKFLSWDNLNFLIYFPVLLICGVFGPILLKKYILSHMPSLDKVTW